MSDSSQGKRTRQKISLDKNGDTQYLWGKDKTIMYTEVTNNEGVAWCENCYNDKVPVLVLNTIYGEFCICQRCINLMFSMRKELST